MEIGRKIYYEIATGNVYVTTSEMSGDIIATTQAQDFQSYMALTGINLTSVDVIQLAFGQYADNFIKYPFHVDPVAKQIVWNTSPQLTLSDTINAKIAQLGDLCQQSLQAFTSNALGSLRTYLSRSDSVNNDWSLYTAEFTFVTGTYYDNNPILWYTVENGNVNHTKNQFVQTFLNARSAVALRKQQLAILQAKAQSYLTSSTPTTDIANVDAISWVDPWISAPIIPIGLTGTAGIAGSGQVALNWTANTDSVMPNGGGYNVYVDGATVAKNTSLITGITFIVTGLTVGSHTFQISAVGANGIVSTMCTAVTVTAS